MSSLQEHPITAAIAMLGVMSERTTRPSLLLWSGSYEGRPETGTQTRAGHYSTHGTQGNPRAGVSSSTGAYAHTGS